MILYRKRLATPGHAFGPDTPWQHEIEEAFPYEETPDQLRAIAGATYTVLRSTDGVTFTQIAKLPNTVTTFSDTGLTFGPNGTTYFYQVVAFSNANNSAVRWVPSRQ